MGADAIGPWVAKLGDWDPGVRFAALDELARRGWQPATAWEQAHHAAATGLEHVATHADPVGARQHAQEAIAGWLRLRDEQPEVAAPLAEALLESMTFLQLHSGENGPNQPVLIAMTKALEALLPDASAGLRWLALEHREEGVRFQATHFLAEAKDPNAILPLARLAQGPHAELAPRWLRTILEWFAAEIPDEDLKAVTELPGGPLARVRALATEELSRRAIEDVECARRRDHLRRWKLSGWPRQWIAGHRGHWNHEQWLKLLGALEHSEFWPMEPDAVGAVLEAQKRDWLQRRLRA
jgi:hypothetical protein